MTWMICLFGGIGAMARYVLDVSIQRSWNRDGNHSFPLATLVINGVASLCAGIAMMSYYAQSVDLGTVMTFVVGVLGGFSTFSSAINEVLSLIRKRRFAMALGYGAATVAVPLACVALGFGIAMLGGAATILGPVLGSCVLWVLLTFVKEVMRNTVPETLISSNQIEALGWVIVGVALMCLVIFRPQGLLGDRKELAFHA